MRTATGILAGAALVWPAAAQDAGRSWIWFASREHRIEKPPRLVLHGKRGNPLEIEASADAPLLAYLADRAFGSLPQCPVGVGDQNRSLVRFAFAELHRGLALERAELVLSMQLGQIAPAGPIEIAVHVVEAGWDERRVTWATQPAFGAQPLVERELEPRAQEVRIDVTETARGWLAGKIPNHGLLLKLAGEHAATLAPDVAARLLRLLAWQPSLEKALAVGKKLERPLLVLVRATYDEKQDNDLELTLLAGAFTDPRLRALVEHRFVPVRIAYSPMLHTQPTGGDASDPLRALGTSAAEVKAPALVVASPSGKVKAQLASIGTFDAGLVLSFLLRALDEDAGGISPTAWELLAGGRLNRAKAAFAKLAEPERSYGLACVASLAGDDANARELAAKALEGALHRMHASGGSFAGHASVELGLACLRLGDRDAARRALETALSRYRLVPAAQWTDQALFWLGCLQRLSGDDAARRTTWQSLASQYADSPWTLRAQAHQVWPARLDPALALVRLPVPKADRATTEHAVAERDVPALASRAARWLVEQQRPDGAWPIEYADYTSAVTALCAKALLVWSEHLPKAEQEAPRAALRRADDWLRKFLARADPEQANSFGTAYVLDYAAERAARSGQKAKDPDLAAAVRLLLGGQCPNGAWSYSKRFGTGWQGGFGGWPKTDQGRVHSINTGPALLFLARARELGAEVDPQALKQGVDALRAMRAGPGRFTYTYPEPRNFEKRDQSIARGPVCEQALWALGAGSAADVAAALAAFREHRAALRVPVKLDASWSSPIASSSYFFFQAYYHAALAMTALPAEERAALRRALRTDVLGCVELDGTWLDFEQNGKPYGTAMALLVLDLTR